MRDSIRADMASLLHDLNTILVYPDIDPVALTIPLPFFEAPLQIHWYGLMYLVAFGVCWWLGRVHARRPHTAIKPEEMSDLLLYVALGVVIGGRLGYMLFYGFESWMADPWEVFRVWEGGMSFHGGLLGVLVAMWLYAWSTRRSFFQISDFVAAVVPAALFFGRVGNFLGGELWGRPADPNLPWAMIFPHVDARPRHPSQIYEALLEGVLLFIIVWAFARKPRPTMAVSGLFALGYGVFRFFVEFVRAPDAHLGTVAFGWMTMGQVLSLPLIVIGVLLLALAYTRQPREVH